MGLRFLKNGVRDLCLTLFVLGVFTSIGTFAPKRTRPTKLSPTNPFPSTGLQCNCLNRRSPIITMGWKLNFQRPIAGFKLQIEPFLVELVLYACRTVVT